MATRLARSGSTSPLGKLDDRFEAFRIEGVVKARFTAIAAEHGKSPAEFNRFVIHVLTYGPSEVKRMHCEQVDEVVKLLGGLLGPRE